MKPRIVDIDLDICREHLYVLGDKLFRVGSDRFSGEITGKNVRVEDKRYQTHRVIFAMENDVERFDLTMLDDDGDLVEINATIQMLFAYRKYEKVKEVKYSGYLCRWLDSDGSRQSKTFTNHDDAVKYQKNMFEKHWGKKLKSLNLYESYFSH